MSPDNLDCIIYEVQPTHGRKIVKKTPSVNNHRERVFLKKRMRERNSLN